MNTQDNAKYKQPSRRYDWSLTNEGDGKVLLVLDMPVLQIGELKQYLRDIADKLDKFAEEWGVPNNLDGRGRARY